jgi:hypothetical protein
MALPDGEMQQRRDESMMRLNVGGFADIEEMWDGRHVDDPPCPPGLPYHPLVNAYTMGYDVFDHVGLTQMPCATICSLLTLLDYKAAEQAWHLITIRQMQDMERRARHGPRLIVKINANSQVIALVDLSNR